MQRKNCCRCRKLYAQTSSKLPALENGALRGGWEFECEDFKGSPYATYKDKDKDKGKRIGYQSDANPSYFAMVARPSIELLLQCTVSFINCICLVDCTRSCLSSYSSRALAELSLLDARPFRLKSMLSRLVSCQILLLRHAFAAALKVACIPHVSMLGLFVLAKVLAMVIAN